jgi:phosphoribosylformimino-5-aminoimidazole carboxamide ribotide isomerase
VELIPAIDLRAGRVVRLVAGDFACETTYGDDALLIARRWVGEGATRLHIVDLDGAREGRPVQADLVARVVAGAGVPCQVAGGLRDAAAVEAALAAGADRVVLGTALLRDPGFASRLVARHGSERIVVALDVRAGLALGEGWRAGAGGVAPDEALRVLAAAGVERFAATAVDRDGLLEGPDLDLLGRLVALRRGRIIASGGISSIADLRAVRSIGCAGAIVGRALYEGRIDLAEALAALD